jgi:biopolymer transport protein ExbD
MTAFREPVPMLEINTTPLIDAMLVLLIMFIITIPPATHAVKLDLPSARPVADIDPIKNKLVITEDGRVLWNGSVVTMEQLRGTLAASQQLERPPELHVQPEPAARYGLVDEVLATTKQARVERMGFVGNERYASF